MAKSKSTKKVSDNKPKKSIKKVAKKIPDSSVLKELKTVDKEDTYPGSVISTADPMSHGLLKTWNMKLVSWNVNGLRASIKNKALEYLMEEDADIMGIQEIKCSEKDLPAEAKKLKGYKSFFSNAEKSGYAGTGLYSKVPPMNVSYGIGIKDHDQEGRVITAEYDQFYFITAYIPNSGRGLVRLDYRKDQWDVDFAKYLKSLDQLKPIIVCGDLNVSHLDIDLANPKTNTKTAGFTKEEREGFGKLLDSVDLVDTFRHIYPDRKNAYTFWSYMGGARAKNVGWRLDYFLISRRLLPSLCNQELRSEVPGSDHCPIVLYLNL